MSPPTKFTALDGIWLVVLRGYLTVAAGPVLTRNVQFAIGG
ncbi:MAG TPA: hypothetical protein VIY09_07795 [Rhizomicrobium sp.]